MSIKLSKTIELRQYYINHEYLNKLLFTADECIEGIKSIGYGESKKFINYLEQIIMNYRNAWWGMQKYLSPDYSMTDVDREHHLKSIFHFYDNSIHTLNNIISEFIKDINCKQYTVDEPMLTNIAKKVTRLSQNTDYKNMISKYNDLNLDDEIEILSVIHQFNKYYYGFLYDFYHKFADLFLSTCTLNINK